SYNSTYASSPAAAAVYNAAVQSQTTPHTPTIGAAVGATNPTSVYASFSTAAAPTPSPYAAAYATNPTAAAYAQYGQTAAAVASLQQQQQQQVQQQVQQQNYNNLQLQAAAAATGVVSASAAAYPGPTATRLTDTYNTIGSVSSTGSAYASLPDYTSSLRTAAAAAASAVTNPTSNSSFLGVTRIGPAITSQPANSALATIPTTGTNNTSILQKFTTSNYSPYDAAVYAAANSYLQSKAAGTSNLWMGTTKKTGSAGFGGSSSFSGITSSNIAVTGGGSGGTGRGGQTGQRVVCVPFPGRGVFPNKRFGNTRPTDMQQFYCEVCKISCAGAQTYKEHMDGQKHKKKEALQKGEGQTLSKSRISFRCETCNVTCTGKDTYESHLRGSKHQKVCVCTANLMKKLGKPVPETPTVLAPGEKSNKPGAPTNGNPISTVGGPAVPTKRAALAAEKEVQPVGEDYVEEERNAAGKLIQYNCKLCDCKFSDPNAKNIHIKGRKHRLQYKVVSFFCCAGLLAQPRPVGPPQPLFTPPPVRPWCGVMDPGRRAETVEDRHVMAKHRLIYPEESQLAVILELVTMTEKALKAVSDKLAEEESQKAKKEGTEEKKTDGVPPSSADGLQPDRVLKGVMRVGLLAKGLLLNNDREVQLVVLCSQIPTRALLSKVAKLLPELVEVSRLFLLMRFFFFQVHFFYEGRGIINYLSFYQASFSGVSYASVACREYIHTPFY
ncbi:unnamed protein product, partial [Gongylonema pulchrum]|uniref:DZF domain-containing protein n=1 Tax=Gongylonema pulchrum TaxID=637853 RepID=A0A183DTN8_9BILA